MKKGLSVFVALFVMLLCLPFGPHASAADNTYAIDMRGTKTYIGSTSDWGKAWDAQNFRDVTNQDVTQDGNVTLISGKVRNLKVTGSDSKLTVQGGLAYVTTCDGAVSVTGGTLQSLKAYGDISVTGGNIRQIIESDGGTVSISNASTGTLSLPGSVTGDKVSFGNGKVQLNGPVKGGKITFQQGSDVTVGGNVSATDTVELDACNLSVHELDGNGSAILNINGYKNSLPKLNQMQGIMLAAGNTVVTNQAIKTGSLSIPDKANFITYAPLEADYIQGPGTLGVDAGALTINDYVSDSPVLAFLTPVSNGTTVMRSVSGAIYPSEVQLLVGNLKLVPSGNAYLYQVQNDAKEGLDLSSKSLSITSGKSGTVKAVISPGIVNYAAKTKIVWKLYGDTSAFTISQSTDQLTCTVSSSTKDENHKAVLVAYLTDQRGDQMMDYRADSCVVSTQGTDNSNLVLDTTVAPVLTGDKYGILASGVSSKPTASSSNSSVAAVDDGKEVKDKNGNTAWLFTTTGGNAGTATIDIGGKKVVVNVNSGIYMDTMSYTMAPNAQYCVGLMTKGVSENDVQVSSTGDCIGVKFYKKGSDGKILYKITGTKSGTADVVYQITGGQSVRTRITVQDAAKPHGESARLVALKQ